MSTASLAHGMVEDTEPSLRRPAIAALSIILGAFGGFAAWLILAPLDGAAVAPGVVVVDSHRKTVQHLEGGIVKQLHVREGALVKAGQPLLSLDATQAEAVLGQSRAQALAAQARIARLRAEQEGAALAFPAELTAAARGDAAVADIVANQTRLFDSRRDAYEGEIALRRKRIEQLEQEAAGYRAQLSATEQHVALSEEELVGVAKLYRQGYERKPRMLELQRSIADLRGRQGELTANIARSGQQVAAAELEIAALRNQRAAEVAKELQDTQQLTADLADRIRGAEDVLARKQVLAPLDGKVVELKVFTVGGVVTPGMPILDIVPQDELLLIEAHVNPIDIDVVRVGLPAQVRLTAYKQRQVPSLAGRVVQVSADQLKDPRSGEGYFIARIELSPQDLAAVGAVELWPGMPAEVFIETGERSAVDYLLGPITDSMRRSFREQ